MTPYLLKLRDKCKNDFKMNVNDIPLLNNKLSIIDWKQKKSNYREFLSFEKEFMKKVVRDLGNIPALLVISDNRGYIIDMYGDEDIQRQLRSLGITERIQFNVENAGVNSISMALHLGEAVQVFGEEHYHACLHNTVCTSVPLYLSEFIVGTVSIMTTMDDTETDYLHALHSAVNLAQRFRKSEEAYDLYYKEIFQYIGRMTKNEEVAKDLCQETFVKVLSSIDSVNKEKSIRSWIYRIAHNTFVTWYRKETQVKLTDIDSQPFELYQSSHQHPERYIEEIALTEEIEGYLSKLKAEYKYALVLREYHELTYQEIADVMGWKLSKVKTVLHRARIQLRKMIDYEMASIKRIEQN